jgi:hypothetical protein
MIVRASVKLGFECLDLTQGSIELQRQGLIVLAQLIVTTIEAGEKACIFLA